MKHRIAEIWPRQQYTADKTEIIEVKVKDPISRLSITYEPDNNGSGANATAHPAKCISKIELVDGSDVLVSLTGQEAQAVDFFDSGIVRPSIMCYLSGMYSEMIFNVNFGRRLYDPLYAIDPTKFKGLQLKITMDIDGGGDEANDGYLTVMGHIFDEREVKPEGFLMTKEHREYSLGASSSEPTELPTDFPYKQIFHRTQVYGTGPEGIIDTIKLSQDEDKKVPLNLTMYQILRNIMQEWPPYEEWILVASNTTTGEYYYCTPCYWPNFANSEWRAAATAIGTSQYEGDGGRFKHSASTVNCNVSVHVKGWAPHAMIPLLPRYPDDVTEWLDVANIDSLKLTAKTTSSGASTQSSQIVTQQLRKYAA